MARKDYTGMILMVAAVAAGAVVGSFRKEAAAFVKPVGDIFLNILFAVVVPMVFFSVSSAFCGLRKNGVVSRTLRGAVFSFASLWLAGGALAYAVGMMVSPLEEGFAFPHLSADTGGSASAAIVGMFSVPDFPMLFSKSNLLPLMIFAALLGVGTAAAGEKGEPFAKFLNAGNEVISVALGALMKVAPLGLGCYFAATVASFGEGLLEGYLRVFVIYCCVAAIMYFIVNPLFVALRKKSVRSFFTSVAEPSLIALATSSSAAAMPSNITAARKMGVSGTCAEAVVPLATNMLKNGSVILDVYKVMFLLLLSGGAVAGPIPAAMCIGFAILSALVSCAVTNGGVTGELLICSLLGVDPSMAGIIMIIGTICDIPATVLNSQSTVVAAILSEGKTPQKQPMQ